MSSDDFGHGEGFGYKSSLSIQDVGGSFVELKDGETPGMNKGRSCMQWQNLRSPLRVGVEAGGRLVSPWENAAPLLQHLPSAL